MDYPADEHPGARVADCRKLRQLTQSGLAQRAFISRGTVAKIEAGLTPPSTAILASIARALEVSVETLNGQPYLSELRQDRMDRMIAPLSDALDLYDLGPDPELVPRSSAELAADVHRLCTATCATEYRGVGGELPALLVELITALHTAQDGSEERRQLARSLSWSHWIAYEFAHRLGYHHLAAIALERMGCLASQAQDPLLLALRTRYRSAALLRRGNSNLATRILDRGHQLVGQHDETDSVPALVVAGSLHLAGAIAAAQARDAERVRDHMGLAREHADRIGRDVPQIYWASFGPTNVAHFDVANCVELGKLGEAAHRAREVHFPAGHPKMRVGRYHIEMARAYSQMGKPEAAEKALHRAREAAPQQARYHPAMRSTVGVLVRRRRRASHGLASLAAWVGM